MADPVGGGFHEIISLENLFAAWREFRRGKRKKPDIQRFEFDVEKSLINLHYLLTNKAYIHLPYKAFYIQDPKLRHIHKACVRDRVVHQAVFRILYPLFDIDFIDDSYSCRFDKGTHCGVTRLETFLREGSGGGIRTVYALKCDIRKFFDSVRHDILLKIIENKIKDRDTMWLIQTIIKSFQNEKGRGLPLGNVTSQLFANIYLNELDQYMKYDVQVKWHVRYCDDFIMVSENPAYLYGLLPKIKTFLKETLKMELHERKIIFRKYSWGVDFLGYVLRPGYRALRTKTKRRLLKRACGGEISYQSFQSYRGVLKYCSGYNIEKQLRTFLKS